MADLSPSRDLLRSAYRRDETEAVEDLLDRATLPEAAAHRVREAARDLVLNARNQGVGGIEALLNEYSLSNPEGIALLSLAEALARIPDQATVARLIKDKLGPADWESHLGHSESMLVNASSFALMLSGRLLRASGPSSGVGAGELGAPVIRRAVSAAMKFLARHFVMGTTIDEALRRARPAERKNYRHSYDMLGEAARTRAQALGFFRAYEEAIAAIAEVRGDRDLISAPGLSIKLSALHPRYQESQRKRVMRELLPLTASLAARAKEAGIGLTLDAEESTRLELQLDILEALSHDPALRGWDGLGLAVQAYQKRALPLLEWLAALARAQGRRFMVRLVKGAYWDSEIKQSQQEGLESYPVFTRKLATDVSYIACAKFLFQESRAFFPQFATHNAQTMATVLELAGTRTDWEFQRLHGMGEALHDQIVVTHASRIYAPVGRNEDLLGYLVRRLLENGANTSFINRLVDADAPIDSLIADPVEGLRATFTKPHPRIPLPADLFGEARRNSRGIDLSDRRFARDLGATSPWQVGPIIGGREASGARIPRFDPADRRRLIGEVIETDPAQLDEAMRRAHGASPGWDGIGAQARARILDRAGDLIEGDRQELLALLVREGGRTIADALSEHREAVDYCRYYAGEARRNFAEPQMLPGPTGERNSLALHGRGVFACIAPWNFPLAIFTGQVVAALAAGNAVLAKPARQTPLVAGRAVRLLHEAGVPNDVLHLVPGDGGALGARLIIDPRLAGVALTGGNATAAAINRGLARRDGPILPFIAETGGQNAMIVDSTALPEKVVDDVLLSAFNSAGQRCSALRVLFVQSAIYVRVTALLRGAMEELVIGDPGLLASDIGPVIDEKAREALIAHETYLRGFARILYRCTLPETCAHGCFFPPLAVEIDRMARLDHEVFGPILHVIPWSRDHLDAVIDAVNATGYGLTLGIASRVDATIAHIHRRARVGNVYVNRSMIGAVVGVQPFGGEGLSGTGPKAGGPHTLHRFAVERTLSVDTTAAGGNASLLTLGDGA